MAEVLSRKLSAEITVDIIPGIRAPRGAEPINHALFTDDSLLLGGASLNITCVFNGILQKFCSISGALINKETSAV